MRKIAILIPNLDGINSLPNTIESIIQNTKYKDYRIIINDSGSADGVEYYLNYLEKRWPNKITIIRTKKEGTTKAINQMIRKTEDDEDILLTQNDVIYPRFPIGCFLSLFAAIYEQHPEIGIITPINGGGVSGPDYVTGFIWTGTWCMFLPKKTIEKVGMFDENFSPGPGDDIDYSYRVARVGLKTIHADFAVNHHRSTEHEYEQQDIVKRNAKYFRDKFKDDFEMENKK